jgi:uncharacterized protein involved in exopolysaccharide biosynthesis
LNTQHSDTIELGQVARTLANGWRAIAGFTLLGIVAAGATIAFAPRKFTGLATIVLKATGGVSSSSPLSQVTGLGDITAGLLGGKSSLETEIEILSSKAVIGLVIDSLFLQARVLADTPLPAMDVLSELNAPGSFKRRRYRFEKKPSAPTYAVTGPDVNAQMVPGTPLSLPEGRVTFAAGRQLPERFDLQLRDKEDALKWVGKHVAVDKEKGDVASVTYKGDDSVTAARVPNALLDVYLTRRRTTDRGINQRRVEFLTAKNDSMEQALALAGQSLRRQQEASGVLDPEATVKVELESGAAMRSRLTDILVEQGALSHLLDQVKSNTLDARELAAYPRFLGSPVINSLVGQLNDLENRRTMLLSQHQEGDRDVVALDKTAANVKSQLVPYAETYANALARQRADLEASIATINDRLARLPAAAESSLRLQRDVLDLSKMSAVLQAQIVEAKIAAIGEGGDVRPLDLAMVPKKPSFPEPWLTAGVGTFGGLICGLVAALLVGSVGRWVRDPMEVERTTGIPTLQFDPAVPLLVTSGSFRTIVVAPVEMGIPVTAVVNRLAQTATSRALSAAVLDLSGASSDVHASIQRLEAEHDVVIIQLSSLVSDSAAAALQHTRPVLLVAPARRVDRRRLIGAVQMLKRLEVPVVGIVMSNGAGRGHVLTA